MSNSIAFSSSDRNSWNNRAHHTSTTNIRDEKSIESLSLFSSSSFSIDEKRNEERERERKKKSIVKIKQSSVWFLDEKEEKRSSRDFSIDKTTNLHRKGVDIDHDNQSMEENRFVFSQQMNISASMINRSTRKENDQLSHSFVSHSLSFFFSSKD